MLNILYKQLLKGSRLIQHLYKLHRMQRNRQNLCQALILSKTTSVSDRSTAFHKVLVHVLVYRKFDVPHYAPYFKAFCPQLTFVKRSCDPHFK